MQLLIACQGPRSIICKWITALGNTITSPFLTTMEKSLFGRVELRLCFSSSRMHNTFRCDQGSATWTLQHHVHMSKAEKSCRGLAGYGQRQEQQDKTRNALAGVANTCCRCLLFDIIEVSVCHEACIFNLLELTKR